MAEMPERAPVKWLGVAAAIVLATLNVLAAAFLLIGFVDVLGRSTTSFVLWYTVGAVAEAAGIGAIVVGIVQVARARLNACWLLAGGSALIVIPELAMMAFLASSGSTGMGSLGNALGLLGGLIALSVLAIVAAMLPATRRNVQLRAA